MYDVYPNDWPVAYDPADSRNQFHETAVLEARIASDVRQYRVEAPEHPGLITRIRFALAGGPAVAEPCNCPA